MKKTLNLSSPPVYYHIYSSCPSLFSNLSNAGCFPLYYWLLDFIIINLLRVRSVLSFRVFYYYHAILISLCFNGSISNQIYYLTFKSNQITVKTTNILYSLFILADNYIHQFIIHYTRKIIYLPIYNPSIIQINNTSCTAVPSLCLSTGTFSPGYNMVVCST